MLYFDLAIYREDLLKENELNNSKLIRYFIYYFRKWTGGLKLNIAGRDLIILPKINKRILKKVEKMININASKTVCISNELRLNMEFVKFLNMKNINILDGRWLFKYLVVDILDFVCKEVNITSETQEISILTNENNNLIFESIKRISEKVKNINIITRNVKLFKKLEKEIYEENGLIIKVTNDFSKFSSKLRIVLNFNFVQEDIDKISFGKNAIIINFENKLKINQKSFTGKVRKFLSYKFTNKVF